MTTPGQNVIANTQKNVANAQRLAQYKQALSAQNAQLTIGIADLRRKLALAERRQNVIQQRLGNASIYARRN